MSKRLLAKFIGYAVSLSPALPTGRFNLLPLYDVLNTVSSRHKLAVVRLNSCAYRRLLNFWMKLSLQDCISYWDLGRPDDIMCTDASDFGFGAHLSKVLPSELVSGTWNTVDANTHITYKELKAIQLALELLSHKIASKHLVVFSDSASTVAIL